MTETKSGLVKHREEHELSGTLEPLPPEIKAFYYPERTDVFALSLSDTITHVEDIPFDRYSGRTYSLTLSQVLNLIDECGRVLKLAGEQNKGALHEQKN